jgi:hypothetical protein
MEFQEQSVNHLSSFLGFMRPQSCVPVEEEQLQSVWGRNIFCAMDKEQILKE